MMQRRRETLNVTTRRETKKKKNKSLGPVSSAKAAANNQLCPSLALVLNSNTFTSQHRQSAARRKEWIIHGT